MERMNTLDAGLYYADTDRTPLHIASVTVLEGPAPAFTDLVEIITAKLPRLPRYRQRVRTAPLNLDVPVWVDDPGFHLRRHVRHVSGPRRFAEFTDLVGGIMSERLDPGGPLWELWMIEGLADGRWALIAKVHHCVVDGVGGSDLLTVLFDQEPDPPPPDVPVHGDGDGAGPGPSATALALSGIGRNVVRPARSLVRQVVRAPALPFRAERMQAAREFATGLPRALEHLAHPPAGSLGGPTGPRRRWLCLDADLEDAKAVRQAADATVNDVILAAVTHGFRELLAGRGELADGPRVRSLVPVSVRDTRNGSLGNKVSAVVVELPCGEPDPLGRLDLVRRQMAEVKQTRQASGTEALMQLAGTAPVMLPPAARAVLAAARPLFQTVITNVPGPRTPLYVLGGRVLSVYPYVPIAAGVGISVGIISYLGSLCFGLTGDFDTTSDLHVLAEGIKTGLQDLVTLTGG